MMKRIIIKSPKDEDNPQDVKGNTEEAEIQVNVEVGPEVNLKENSSEDLAEVFNAQEEKDNLETTKDELGDDIENDKPEIPEIDEEDEQADSDDPELEGVVEDIQRTNSDELLEKEDAEIRAAFSPGNKEGLIQKSKRLFKSWWHNKKARKFTIIGLVGLVLILIILPPSRYFIMNLFGFRVKASLSVIDYKTQLPLKNIKVKLAGSEVLSNEKGIASFDNVKQGKTNLIIEKRGFATLDKEVTLGFGSNPLGEYSIESTGETYKFVIKDWLSGKPIEKSEAVSGDASAFSDKEGRISLVVGAEAIEGSKIIISAEGFRNEIFNLSDLGKGEKGVKMVPSKKHTFVSKRSGKFDIYSIDADGKNEKLVLSATGYEGEDMVIVPHQTENIVALVSTRENIRNRDSFVLSSLFILDLNSGNLNKLAQSERIQVIDWHGNRLIYVTVAEGVSASNPRRHRLVSYDYQEKEKVDLASSNYFNDILSAGGRIFYAPSEAYQQQNKSNVKLFSVMASGGDKKTLLNHEVWNIFRTSYDKLSISSGADWYEYKLGENAAVKTEQKPVNPQNILFIDNNSKDKTIWVDQRDGKGVLLLKNINTGSDRILESRSGIIQPAYWLNSNSIVFRVSTKNETADYIINIDGGAPAKIVDVTNTSGIDNWYFY